jgi:hypothetical protein
MMRDDARDATGDEDVVAQTEELAKFLSSYVDAGGSLDANEAPEEMKPLLQSMQQAFSTLSSTAGGGAQVAPTEMLDLIRQAAKGALRDPALEASTSERAPPVRVPTTRLSEKEIRLQPGFVVKSRDGNGGKAFLVLCVDFHCLFCFVMFTGFRLNLLVLYADLDRHFRLFFRV